MEKVLACVERISVVKGVSGGFITNEQVDSLCLVFGFDEHQKQQVFAQLEANRIVPIAEDEVPEKLRPASPKPPQPIKLTPEERKLLYKERFAEELEKFQLAIEDEPELARKYQREIPVLKQALADRYRDTQSTTMEKVMAAVLHLSHYRIRPYRKYGWICGTYMRSVERHFEKWLRYAFQEPELEQLLVCCGEDGELTLHQMQMVVLLIHHAPNIHLNLRLTGRNFYCE